MLKENINENISDSVDFAYLASKLFIHLLLCATHCTGDMQASTREFILALRCSYASGKMALCAVDLE